MTENLLGMVPEKAQLKDALVKKFRLVSANAWLKLCDYERASKAIELCCAMIHKGEKDELKVYFLAFKMHCQLRDKEEAIQTFEQIYSATQVSAEPLLECFNVLVQCRLFDVALGLGGHLLKACDKFLVDAEMKKRFLLKFLFVFDLAVAQGGSETQLDASEELFPGAAAAMDGIGCSTAAGDGSDDKKVALDPKQIESVI